MDTKTVFYLIAVTFCVAAAAISHRASDSFTFVLPSTAKLLSSLATLVGLIMLVVGFFLLDWYWPLFALLACMVVVPILNFISVSFGIFPLAVLGISIGGLVFSTLFFFA